MGRRLELVLLVGRARGDDGTRTSETTLVVNATPVGDRHGVTVVPCWEPGDIMRVSWTSDGDETPRRAIVVGAVDLQSFCPAYAELLTLSPRQSFRSTMLLFCLDGEDMIPEWSAGFAPMKMGDALRVVGWPFPSLLGSKFESSHNAFVSCALTPMYLLDASLSIGGLEGAPLVDEKRVVRGFLGDPVLGMAGARFLVGWDLSACVAAAQSFGRTETVETPYKLPPTPSTPSCTDDHLIHSLSRLVSVHVDHSFGTGFLISGISGHAIICTNAHVVGAQYKGPVYVRRLDGQVFPAVRWATFDGLLDLAFLRVPDLVWSDCIAWPAIPSMRDLVGTPIVAIGFPGTWNPCSQPVSPLSGPKATRGYVTSVLSDDLGACCLTTDASITDGNSGSPIFDPRDGCLVGMASSNAVVVSSGQDGEAAKSTRHYHPNLNFCLPAAMIHDTLSICIKKGPHAARLALGTRKIDTLLCWRPPARL